MVDTLHDDTLCEDTLYDDTLHDDTIYDDTLYDGVNEQAEGMNSFGRTVVGIIITTNPRLFTSISEYSKQLECDANNRITDQKTL